MRSTDTHTWRLPEPEALRNAVRATGQRVASALSRRNVQHALILCVLFLVPRCIELDAVLLTPTAVAQLEGASRVLAGAPPLAPIVDLGAEAASPLLALVLSIPTLLGRDPRLAVAALCLLHLAALLVTFSLIRRYQSERAAWGYALLMSFSPWMIHQSRLIGVQALVIPLSMLLFATMVVASEGRSPWMWVVSGALMGLLLLATWLALPLMAPLLVVALLASRRKARGHMLLGLLLCALIAFSTLYSDTGQSLTGLYELGTRITTSHDLTSEYRTFLSLLPRVAGGRALPTSPNATPAAIPFMSAFGRVLALAFVAGAVYSMFKAAAQWSAWNRGNWVLYMVTGVWLWVLLLVTLLTPFAQQLTATALLFPAGFVAIALLVDDAITPFLARLSKARWWRQPARLILMLLLGIAFAGQWLYAYRISNENATHATIYAAPNRFWRRTAALAQRGAEIDEDHPLYVLLGGEDRDEMAFSHAVLGYFCSEGGELAYVQSKEAMLPLPVETPMQYLVVRDGPRVVPIIRQLAATNIGSVEFPGNGPTPRLYKVPASSVEDTLAMVPHRGLWRTDSGLHLIGYDWQPGRLENTGLLRTFWAIDAVLPTELGQEHQIVAQLTDADGQLRGTSKSRFGLEAQHWVEGGVVTQWTQLDLSEMDDSSAEWGLLVGVYRETEGTLAAHVDQHGNALGDSIYLGDIPLPLRASDSPR